MKNKRLEERRSTISKDIDNFVKHSFDIVDRIHEILLKQGKEQKDLALALGKSESEISKWMTGTHNFTIKTLSKIEEILGEPVIRATKEKQKEKTKVVFIQHAAYSMNSAKKTSNIPMHLGTTIYKPLKQSLLKCLN